MLNTIIGTDAKVNYNVNFDPDIPTLNPKTGKIADDKRPTQIGLGHELIHADHIMRGTVQLSKSDNDDVYDEEKATVGLKYNTPKDITENDLRKEQGVNPRGDYWC